MNSIIDVVTVEGGALVVDVQVPPALVQSIDIAVDRGAQGPPGPTAISADANNAARLGSDNLTFVPITISSAAPSGGSDGDIWFRIITP